MNTKIGAILQGHMSKAKVPVLEVEGSTVVIVYNIHNGTVLMKRTSFRLYTDVFCEEA